MKLLVQTFTDPILRLNNLRAIGIHAVLSVIGFAVAFVILFFVAGLVSGLEWVLIFFTLFGGVAIYIICGYKYLRCKCEKPFQSVLWLAVLTLAVGVLSGLVTSVFYLVATDDYIGLYSSITILEIAVNAIGFGSMMFAANVMPEANENTFAFLRVVAAALPPGLLYLGLRLKIWRSGRNAGYTEVGDEMGEMRTVAVVESPSCSASE